MTECPLFLSHDIIDFQEDPDFYCLKAIAFLKDGTELHILEFISPTKVRYSYHWQNPDGTLIIRWDNAPHHPELRSFPNHKHNSGVEESKVCTLQDAIEEIEKTLG
ncbi:MAG TPA: DUF6516 family protein [Candidatus Lokiarchaeia archaeon]|nr:DUF6516 family protein [Candidatus Lokiarchaeia archaeon]